MSDIRLCNVVNDHVQIRNPINYLENVPEMLRFGQHVKLYVAFGEFLQTFEHWLADNPVEVRLIVDDMADSYELRL